MGVRQNKPVSRPDGEPGPSGRTTVRQDFPKFSQRNLSCIRTSSGRDGLIVQTDARPLQVISTTGFARPDQGAGASGRPLNFNTQFPYLIRVRPDHEGWDVWTVEVESAVSIYDAPTSGPQLSDVRTVKFELWFLPYGDTRPDDILHRPDGWLIFHFLELGKNQRTVRELSSVRTWYWNDRTEASWHRSFSILCRCPDGRSTSSGRMMLDCLCPDGMARRPDVWSRNSRRPDGMTHRPDDWQGT
jgi:hypothetical protein